MQFIVTVTDAYNDKRIYGFDEKKAHDGIHIGRHRTSDIILKSLMISNNHCTIKTEGSLSELSKISVTDTSSNGTPYNNKDIGKGNTISININDNIRLDMSISLFYSKGVYELTM